MKFHSTLVNELVMLFEINSGWRDQRKLREALAKLDLTVYTQQSGGQVLISTEALNKKITEQRG